MAALPVAVTVYVFAAGWRLQTKSKNSVPAGR
jgi:hypothetical protein